MAEPRKFGVELGPSSHADKVTVMSYQRSRRRHRTLTIVLTILAALAMLASVVVPVIVAVSG